MSIFMESTKIAPERTVADIQKLLGVYGANAVLIEYNEKKEVSGVSFQIQIGPAPVPFTLPCRWEAIFRQLQKHRKMKAARFEDEDRAKAKRVAWRQILRWVEAQLALVETGMVNMEEVFMPYIQVGANKTLYQELESKGLPRLLGTGGQA